MKINYKLQQIVSKFSLDQKRERLKMDLFRRMGTQKKKFKVQFFIGRLKFSQYRGGQVYIVIKRGDHKVKSEQKLQMTKDNKLNFNKEILEIEATLYFDQKENKYQQKIGELSVVLLDQKQNKILLGTVPFDLANYANSGQQSVQEKRKLQQTPKKFSGLIQFNVFVKYIGEGSQSSIDKVSDFFFGKSKDEPANSIVKQKNQEDSPVKKRTEKSSLKKEKQRQKTKEKPSIKPEFLKYNVSKSKQKFDFKSKIQINKKQSSHVSDDQQESQNQNKEFYFDEPFLSREKKQSNQAQNIKKSTPKEKIGFEEDKKVQNKQKNSIKQKSFHYDAESPSENEDVETSEVEPIQVFDNFGQSQVESINSEPLKPTKNKTQEKNFVKNRSKVELINKNNEKQDKKSLRQNQIQKEQVLSKNKNVPTSKQPTIFDEFYEVKQQRQRSKQGYQQKLSNQSDIQEKKSKLSSSKSPSYIKQTQSVFTKQHEPHKSDKEEDSIAQIKKSSSRRDQKLSYSDLQKQNQKLKISLQKSQQIIHQLENQKGKFTQQISELSSQIQFYQLELKQKQDEINHFQEKTVGQDKSLTEKYLQDIKKIEREKNQLIVENSKLKQKYKKDFARYEQILQEKETAEQQYRSDMKAEIQRFKQQNSSFRQKIEKLTREKDDKTSESYQQKKTNKMLQNQLSEVKDSLSRIKLKICNMLNEALSTGEQSQIQLLMELNNQ